jgi:hypothetical protein
MKNDAKKYLQALHQFQQLIINLYIRRDYQQAVEEYEQLIRKSKKNILKKFQYIRLSKSQNNSCFTVLEHLYELFFSLSRLRLQVKDFNLLETCEIEFKQLQTAFQDIFLSLINDEAVEFNNLSIAILHFEEIFQETLQFVAFEPLIILFFIQTLVAIREELENLLKC